MSTGFRAKQPYRLNKQTEYGTQQLAVSEGGARGTTSCLRYPSPFYGPPAACRGTVAGGPVTTSE
jgi:hypothetical protein